MICLDNTALMCLMRRPLGDPHRQYQQDVIDYCDRVLRSGDEIAVPTPVVAEFITRYPHEDEANEAERALRESGFLFLDFDFPCAALCARLAYRGDPNRGMLGLSKELNYNKQSLKVDLQIASIAIYHRASAIVTGDERFQSLCDRLRASGISLLCHLLADVQQLSID